MPRTHPGVQRTGVPPGAAKPPPALILASTSASRRALLDGLGLPYTAVAPEFDETKALDLTAADLAEALALGKARSVSARFPEALVLGADQVLLLEGRLLDKPLTLADARAQLLQLNGRSHVLITGLALVCEATHALKVSHEATRLSLRQLGTAEVDAYLATGEWKDCLGGYRVEGQGLKLFAQIEGDLTNARGLPLVRLCNALRELEFPLF